MVLLRMKIYSYLDKSTIIAERQLNKELSHNPGGAFPVLLSINSIAVSNAIRKHIRVSDPASVKKASKDEPTVMIIINVFNAAIILLHNIQSK